VEPASGRRFRADGTVTAPRPFETRTWGPRGASVPVGFAGDGGQGVTESRKLRRCGDRERGRDGDVRGELPEYSHCGATRRDVAVEGRISAGPRVAKRSGLDGEGAVRGPGRRSGGHDECPVAGFRRFGPSLGVTAFDRAIDRDSFTAV